MTQQQGRHLRARPDGYGPGWTLCGQWDPAPLRESDYLNAVQEDQEIQFGPICATCDRIALKAAFLESHPRTRR